MNRWFLASALVAVTLTACDRGAAPTATGSPPATALVGATLIAGTGAPPVDDAVVIVEGERIACAGHRDDCTVPADALVVDLSGMWITPGIVDAHVHFSQTAWADARPDSIDVGPIHPFAAVQAEQRTNPGRYFRAYLCAGVTAVFDVGGFPWTWDLRSRAEDDPLAPHVAAAGPLVSQVSPPQLALPAEQEFINLRDSESGRAGVRYLAANGSDAVKVWFIQPSEEMRPEIDARVMAVGEEAQRQGVPLIVHATELREAKVAVRAGAHLLVHSVEDKPVDEEFIQMLKDRGVIYTPTLTVRDGYIRMYDAAYTGQPPPAVDDPNRCVDTGTLEKIAASAEVGEYISPERRDPTRYEQYKARVSAGHDIMARNLEALYEAGVTIALGTDAGNPLTVAGPSVYAEMEAMQAAGMPPTAVLEAATRNGALAMGRGQDIGTVEHGKIADLLVLGADPTADVANFRLLEAVVRGGVFQRQSKLQRDPARGQQNALAD